jgi:hypothetical protein
MNVVVYNINLDQFFILFFNWKLNIFCTSSITTLVVHMVSLSVLHPMNANNAINIS